jgi:hypothetical protein
MRLGAMYATAGTSTKWGTNICIDASLVVITLVRTYFSTEITHHLGIATAATHHIKRQNIKSHKKNTKCASNKNIKKLWLSLIFRLIQSQHGA